VLSASKPLKLASSLAQKSVPLGKPEELQKSKSASVHSKSSGAKSLEDLKSPMQRQTKRKAIMEFAALSLPPLKLKDHK